jgi:ribosomal protein S1
VANVADAIKVGEVVKVRVLSVDPAAKRLALTRKGLGPKSAATAAAAAYDDDEEGAPGCLSPPQQCCCSMVWFGCLV